MTANGIMRRVGKLYFAWIAAIAGMAGCYKKAR